MAQNISHNGIVEKINGKHILVRICQTSACSSCVAKKLCNSSESKEKTIDIYCENATSYKVGEEVTIVGTIGMGMNAVLWAYVVPLLLLIVALSLAICFIHSEPLSALIAVGVLFIYYLALYFNRNRLSKKFSFNIKPLNQ